MNNYGVPQCHLDDLARVEKQRHEIEAQINKCALENLGVKPGEIMRNKFTGLRYEVKGFRAWVNSGQVRISVDAYRYYQTGRRAGRTARSSSFIGFEDLEKDTQE